MVAAERAGSKVLIAGAVLQLLPDIDGVSALWLDAPSMFLAHRGFTHSIFFVLLTALLAGWLSKPFAHRFSMTPAMVSWFVFIECFTHIFIDAFNAYGTAWFLPFSRERISFHTLYVSDPLFLLAPLCVLVVLFLPKIKTATKKKAAYGALMFSGAYLLFALAVKSSIDARTRRALQTAGTSYREFTSTPAPFNSLLWFVMVRQDSGYLTAYRSLFDGAKDPQWRFIPLQKNLAARAGNAAQLNKLLRFGDDYYTFSQSGDTVFLNALRFGQIAGWLRPGGAFVFRYPLNKKGSSAQLQKGRMAGWDREGRHAFVQRLRGR